MKGNSQRRLFFCDYDNESVVEWDTENSQIVNVFTLDSSPKSIAIDNEGSQWIFCEDWSVRKKRQHGQQFIVEFDIQGLVKWIHGGNRVIVTKKPKVLFWTTSSITVYEKRTQGPAWINTRTVFDSFRSSFAGLKGIAVDSTDRIILCDSHNERVLVLTDELKDVIDLSTRFEFDEPQGVAVDEMDNIFVVEWTTKRIIVFDREGNHLNTLKHSLDYANYIEVMGDSVYVKYEDQLEVLKLK